MMTTPPGGVMAVRTDPEILRVEHVSKVFCEDFQLARTYAIKEIFGIRRRSVTSLRAGEWVVLRDVSFTVRRGEVVVVLGPQGSGKTTLARLACQVQRPDAGRVVVSGRVGRIGPDKCGLNAFMTAAEAVQLLTAFHGVEPGRADEVCRNILQTAGLADMRRTRVVELSNVALRHLALAASLAVERDLYVFDGAVSFGNSAVAQTLQVRVDEILDRETALVLLSRAERLPRRVNRVLVLHDGEIVYEGDPTSGVAAFGKLAHVLRTGEDESLMTRKSGRRQPAAGPRLTAAQATQLLRRAVVHTQDAAFHTAVDQQVAQAWRDGRPVVLGPYLSDPGFEMLYWLPFVAWMKERYGTPGQRVVAISRGRVRAWYGDLITDYVDVSDLPLQGDDRTRVHITTKQLEISDADRTVVNACVRTLGLVGAEAVHPSLLFQMSKRAGHGGLAQGALAERLRYTPRTPATAADAPRLPDGYVVGCPLGFSLSLGDTPDHRRFLAQLLRELSRHATVAVLATSDFLKAEPSIDGGRGVHWIDPLVLTERVDILSHLISHARALVGVFTGLGFLGLFHQIPSLVFRARTDGSFALHSAFVRQASEAMPGTALEIRAADASDALDVQGWLRRVP